jgi:hypothetical protein
LEETELRKEKNISRKCGCTVPLKGHKQKVAFGIFYKNVHVEE